MGAASHALASGRTIDALTLDQLRVFLTVAEEGSFSAAARQLHRAQSAISYAVANLEKLLDLSLFDRSTRRPSLTDAGRALVSDAQAILGQVDILRARSRLMAGGTETEVALAVDVRFPLAPLVENLKAFHAAYPTVPLHLHAEAPEAVMELVADGTCHVGISGPLERFPKQLERQPLTAVPMVAVVAPEHPLAANPRPTPKQLERHTQLLLADRSRPATSNDADAPGSCSWRMADLATKHALLRAGFGWGRMPYHLVDEDVKAGRLVRIYPDETSEEAQLPQYLVHRTADPPGPACRWLIERLKTSCKNGGCTGPLP